MARVLYPDTAYSFRRLHAVIVGDAAAADTQVLARIEQLLVAAGEAFRARRYLDAQPDRERRSSARRARRPSCVCKHAKVAFRDFATGELWKTRGCEG